MLEFLRRDWEKCERQREPGVREGGKCESGVGIIILMIMDDDG